MNEDTGIGVKYAWIFLNPWTINMVLDLLFLVMKLVGLKQCPNNQHLIPIHAL